MTLTELITEVVAITARPDLETETKSAVKAATLKLHHSDHYYRDLREASIAFDSPMFLQEVDLSIVFPRFRAIKYVRNCADSVAGTFLEVLSPEEIFDRYARERTNVAYTAGSVLKIKGATAFTELLVGIYQHPVITDLEYSSWIANDYPYAIIYDAAAKVLRQVAFDESANNYAKLASEELAIMARNNITPMGY